MPEPVSPIEVRVGPQGRLVIPAAWRRALGIRGGDTLLTRLEGDRLIMEKRSTVLDRIHRRFASAQQGPSVVDELIADRRREGQREREG